MAKTTKITKEKIQEQASRETITNTIAWAIAHILNESIADSADIYAPDSGIAPDNPVIGDLVTGLSAYVVRNKLHHMMCDNASSDGAIAEKLYSDIYRVYDFENCMVRVDRQTAGTKAEQCKGIEKCASITLVSDMIQEGCYILMDIISNQWVDGWVDLLSPYEISYCTTYRDGTEKPAEKQRKRWTNGVRECSRAVKLVLERNRHGIETPFSGLTDIDGKTKVSALSAISDSYGDITIDEEMKIILTKWIDEIDITDSQKRVIVSHYLKGIEQSRIAEKYGVSVNRVEKILIDFRKKLSQFIAEKTGKPIEKSIHRTMIVCYGLVDGKPVSKYESVSHAARAIGVTRAAIQKALRCPKVATCGGYTWDKVNI